MDLDEWEMLPVDGFLDFGDDCGETVMKKKKKLEPITVIDMDLEYFRCPSPNRRFSPHKLVPIRIHLDPPIKTHEPPPMEIVKPPSEIDQETVSQVFFKKLDTEFVDMKILDASPRSASARSVSPPIESFPVFEDEVSDNLDGSVGSPRKYERITAEDGDSLFLNNLLKWSFTGIGAVLSFGAVAATVCILITGNRHRNTKQHQKLTFQIYTDDKRIKKVVQRAAKLNEAISVMSGGGAPLAGAHIRFGGYYDGL